MATATKTKAKAKSKAKNSSDHSQAKAKPKAKAKAKGKKAKAQTTKRQAQTARASDQPSLPGMGSLVHPEGVGFRVWGAAAERVEVLGDFNDWQGHDLVHEGNGYWYGFVPEAKVGQEYLYRLSHGESQVTRIDPYARELTNSVGNGIIYDPNSFDWEGDQRLAMDRRDLVIYEMHLGTFASSFTEAAERLRYLEALGINAIELMPVTEFPGDLSWGYNPAHLFAVETSYGGPDGLKQFVKEAHRRGIAVILDVVYNHMGPDDLDLWNWDGSDPQGCGPYFYPDERAETPWGHTRPNYDKPEVRQFLRDNALMWLNEYHMDGLRCDATVYIRRVRAEHEGGSDLPHGWTLMQWINSELHALEPGPITIAEDLQNNHWLTKPVGHGGCGYDAQWDHRLAGPLREMLTDPSDDARSANRLAQVLAESYNGDAYQSVIFTESHDEVANGKARVPQEIDPENPSSFWARARSSLGAFVVLTAPGIPMIFQGQERFEDGWFRDDKPLDWSPQGRDREILHLYHELIVLRTGRQPGAPGLNRHGLEILGVHEEDGWLAYRRFDHDDPHPGSLVLVCLKSKSVEVTLEGVTDGLLVPRFSSGSALREEEVPEPEPFQVERGHFWAPLPGYSVSVYSWE